MQASASPACLIPLADPLQFVPVPGLPMVESGDDLCVLILDALRAMDFALEDDDLLVVTQKIVSKAEGRSRVLQDVDVSQDAVSWAERTDKDPRLVQLILDESVAVLRHRPGLMIVEHRLGYVHADAGIDSSNVPTEGAVLLLPEDSDESATRLQEDFRRLTRKHINVSIIDSAGRAWRNGITGYTIGSAGFEVLSSRVGKPDLFGVPLKVTEVAVADELAGAASFLMGQGDESIPVVLVRGAQLCRSSEGSRALIRDRQRDLFR